MEDYALPDNWLTRLPEPQAAKPLTEQDVIDGIQRLLEEPQHAPAYVCSPEEAHWWNVIFPHILVLQDALHSRQYWPFGRWPRLTDDEVYADPWL